MSNRKESLHLPNIQVQDQENESKNNTNKNQVVDSQSPYKSEGISPQKGDSLISNSDLKKESESKTNLLTGEDDQDIVKVQKESTTWELVKAVFSNGVYLLNYDSSALKKHQKRTESEDRFKCGITAWLCSYWFVVVVILATVLAIAYTEVGNEKGLVMTEEILKEMDIVVDTNNFAFHNLLSLGTESQAKTAIGTKIWTVDNQDTTLDAYLEIVNSEHVKDYLCGKYFIEVENQYTEQTLSLEGCELLTSQSDDNWILHHYLKESQSMSLNIKPRSGESQQINFKLSTDMEGLLFYSQQFFLNKQQDISYPTVFDDEQTIILFATETTQTVGSKQIPQNIQLKYRSEMNITADQNETSFSFYYVDGGVSPQDQIITQDSQYLTKVNMNFNFVQKHSVTTYITLVDAFFDVFFIFPLCIAFSFGLIVLINFYDFYLKISQLIHKEYVDDKHVHRIRHHLKNLTGFREEVLKTDNSELIVATIDKFLNLDYEGKFSYEEIVDLSEKIDGLIQTIQKLGIDTTGIIDKTEQKINAVLTEIIEKRAKMTYGEIINNIKEKVSIFGIYNLQDEFELQQAELQEDVSLQHHKIEFLERIIETQKNQRRRTSKKRAE